MTFQVVPSARFRQLAALVGVPRRDVDDVVQEVLVRLWENQSQIAEADNRQAYVARIALNVARSHLRGSYARREVLTAPEDVDVQDERPGPEEHTVMRRRTAVLWQLLDQLDPAVRDVFVEHELFGVPVTQIAESRAIPWTTARKRIEAAWRDADEARKRWQAAQRRRGEEIVPAFMPWLRSRRTYTTWLHGTAMQGAARATVLALVVAERFLPITWSPLRPVARLASAAPTLLTAAAAATGAAAVPRGAAQLADDVAPAPAMVTLLGPTRIPAPNDTEFGLIARARAALQAHTAAGNVEARRLLEEHAREFPEGRFAAERDALLSRLR